MRVFQSHDRLPMVRHLHPPQRPLLARAAVGDPPRPNPPLHPRQVEGDPMHGVGQMPWLSSRWMRRVCRQPLWRALRWLRDQSQDWDMSEETPMAPSHVQRSWGQEVGPLAAVAGPWARRQEDVLHLQMQGHHHDVHLKHRAELVVESGYSIACGCAGKQFAQRTGYHAEITKLHECLG